MLLRIVLIITILMMNNLESISQDYLSDCYVSTGNENMVLCFIGRDSIEIGSLDEIGKRSFLIRYEAENILVLSEGVPFDTLKIMESGINKVILYFTFFDKYFELIKGSKHIDINTVEPIINNKNLNIEITPSPKKIVKHRTITRNEIYNNRFTSEECSINFDIVVGSTFIGTFLYISFVEKRERVNYSMLITEVNRARIDGYLLEDGSNISMLISEEVQIVERTAIDQLVGSYVLYENHDNLLKSLDKKQKSIHIGFSRYVFNEDGTFFIRDRPDIIEAKGDWEILKFKGKLFIKLKGEYRYKEMRKEYTDYFECLESNNAYIILARPICGATHSIGHSWHLSLKRL